MIHQRARCGGAQTCRRDSPSQGHGIINERISTTIAHVIGIGSHSVIHESEHLLALARDGQQVAVGHFDLYVLCLDAGRIRNKHKARVRLSDVNCSELPVAIPRYRTATNEVINTYVVVLECRVLERTAEKRMCQ